MSGRREERSEPRGAGAASTELVVVAYRSRDQVAGMLAGLDAAAPVVVVDNSDGSDGLRDLVEARPAGRYLSGGGVGFARAANLGARSSSADVLLFVNPDVRPTPADLATLVDDVVADRSIAASAGTLAPGGRPEIGAGGWEPTLRRVLVHAAGLHKLAPRAGLFATPVIGEPLGVDWVNGGTLAVRRELFLELGCFDETFFVYNEDMTFGATARAHGLRVQLRTDVAVGGDSGGSGAPSLEMQRLRGASMAVYLTRSMPGVRALAARALLALGYGARAAERAARGRAPRAREHAAYVAGVLTRRASVAGRRVI